MDIQTILLTYGRYFNQSWFFGISDVFTSIGWGLAHLLVFVVDSAESLLTAAYNLIDFTNYAGVDQFFNRTEVKTLLVILFAGSLLVLGYILIFPKEDGSRPKVVQNLMLAVMILCALPTFMSTMNNLTIQGIRFVNPEDESMANEIVSACVVDLKHLDKNNFDSSYFGVSDGQVTQNPNDVPTSMIRNIDPNEKIKFDDTSINNPEIFKSKLVLQDGGAYTVEEIGESKFFALDFTNYYYRFSIDFLSMYISLIAATIVMFFTAFKVVKLIFELAAHQFLAAFSSAADLTTGQRTKTILKNLMNVYIVLFLTAVMLKLFILGHAFLIGNVNNTFLRAILLIFLAFAVVDGPNIIEKVLGIDAGLSSGFQTVMGVVYGSKMAAGAAKGAVHTAASAGRTAKSVVSKSASVFGRHSNQTNTSDSPVNFSANTENRSDSFGITQNDSLHTSGGALNQMNESSLGGSINNSAADLTQATAVTMGAVAGAASGAVISQPDSERSDKATGKEEFHSNEASNSEPIEVSQRRKDLFAGNAFNPDLSSVSKGAEQMLHKNDIPDIGKSRSRELSSQQPISVISNRPEKPASKFERGAHNVHSGLSPHSNPLQSKTAKTKKLPEKRSTPLTDHKKDK